MLSFGKGSQSASQPTFRLCLQSCYIHIVDTPSLEALYNQQGAMRCDLNAMVSPPSTPTLFKHTYNCYACLSVCTRSLFRSTRYTIGTISVALALLLACLSICLCNINANGTKLTAQLTSLIEWLPLGLYLHLSYTYVFTTYMYV